MKKITIIVFALLFTLCIFPGVSLAADITIDLEAITDSTTGTGYAYSGGVLTLSGTGPFTITTNENTVTDRIIVVSSGVTADITLDDLKIDASSSADVCALDMTGATVNVTLTGTNMLKSGDNRAGLEVPSGSALTVTESSTGKLTVTGGTASAGIGGGLATDCGTVTVYGGEITAVGTRSYSDNEYGGGAGIGGGGCGDSNVMGGNGGTIVIDGGVVNATGGSSAAGIGEGCCGWGYLCTGSDITIKSGTVTATGTWGGAGIGGGWLGGGDTITILGGDLTAIGSGGDHPTRGECGGAGIGGGSNCSCAGDIVITGGNITATGSENAAGIGFGYFHSGTITGSVLIEGGDIMATGGLAGAGIGSSLGNDSTSITITDGNVVAQGKLGGAGIGAGFGGDGGEITIVGGDIIAIGSGGDHPTRGYVYAAGIGGSRTGSAGTIKISNGAVEAIGKYGGAGIGGEGGSIEISGGTVTATGGDHIEYYDYGGAGIGGTGFNSGDSIVISISGGTVYAEKGDDAQNDIGHGISGSGMTLSISGSAAVFMKNDSCVAPTTSHTHYSFTENTDKAYGISVPGEWTPTFGAYLKPGTLSYDANGGSGTVPVAVTQHLNTTVAVANGSALTKTNYTFNGWNTATNGSDTDYAAGATFPFGADTTLYAQWKANTYTVAYDANGGTGITSSSSHTCDVSKALTANRFSREDYTFAGWATSAAGDVVYTAGQSVSNLTAVNGATVTLFAKWTAQPKLTSSVAGGKIFTGGRIVLTPNIDGGTWDWDHSFFSATFNSPATFTALRAGTSTITYTVDGVHTTYDVTIEESELPSTGQDFVWVMLLCALCLAMLTASIIITTLRRNIVK